MPAWRHTFHGCSSAPPDVTRGTAVDAPTPQRFDDRRGVFNLSDHHPDESNSDSPAYSLDSPRLIRRHCQHTVTGLHRATQWLDNEDVNNNPVVLQKPIHNYYKVYVRNNIPSDYDYFAYMSRSHDRIYNAKLCCHYNQTAHDHQPEDIPVRHPDELPSMADLRHPRKTAVMAQNNVTWSSPDWMEQPMEPTLSLHDVVPAPRATRSPPGPRHHHPPSLMIEGQPYQSHRQWPTLRQHQPREHIPKRPHNYAHYDSVADTHLRKSCHGPTRPDLLHTARLAELDHERYSIRCKDQMTRISRDGGSQFIQEGILPQRYNDISGTRRKPHFLVDRLCALPPLKHMPTPNSPIPMKAPREFGIGMNHGLDTRKSHSQLHYPIGIHKEEGWPGKSKTRQTSPQRKYSIRETSFCGPDSPLEKTVSYSPWPKPCDGDQQAAAEPESSPHLPPFLPGVQGCQRPCCVSVSDAGTHRDVSPDSNGSTLVI